MGRFSVPNPEQFSVDPSEFDDEFFGNKNVYANLGKETRSVQTELSPEEQLKLLREVVLKLDKQPDAELSQIEASLIYCVDKDLPHAELQLLADTIKASRGESDHEQVKSLIVERLRSEKYVIQSYGVLSSAIEWIEQAGSEQYSQRAFMETLKTHMQDWEERGVFDYLATKLTKEGMRYNLVPTANGPEIEHLTHEQFYSLVRGFSELLDLSAEYHPDIFKTMYDRCSAQDLTGYDSSLPNIRLSLVPNKYNQELGKQPVRAQLAVLQDIQQSLPDLQLHIPRPLAAVMNWYSLHAAGDLSTASIMARSYVRHIDLKEMIAFDDSDEFYVPESYLGSRDAEPHLNASRAHNGRDNRIALG